MYPGISTGNCWLFGQIPAPDRSGFAAVVELAVSLFLLIIYRMAMQSVEPHNPYERFLLASFGWFFLQAIVREVFFFAKATTATQSELIRRIALIDGTLRDIQVLGFAALVIAGVSQHFVPRVYALAPPRHDRLNLIFVLLNLSLLLDIFSYVAVLSTRNWYYGMGLELAYVLMPVLLDLRSNGHARGLQPIGLHLESISDI